MVKRAKTVAKRAPAKSRRKSEDRAIAGARPAWSGSLRLALVTVPVKLYPATKSGARIEFHQVHKPSGKRIRYEKVVPGIGPVDPDEIVKGYEIEKDRYVLLEEDEVESVKLEARRTIDLVQFVPADGIDPIWFDRPYYVVPDGELAEEAYAVLRDALRETGKIGIGQFIMRGREYIAALKPSGHGLTAETLRFADEVRAATPYFADVGKARTDDELLELAEELIGRKTAPFDAGKFKDSYTEALRALIEAKSKRGRRITIEEEEPSGGGAKVIDLVEALKRSVRQSGSGTRSGRAAGRKAS